MRERGERYDRENRVVLESVEDGLILANVEGSSSRYYSVSMRWDDGDPLFLRAQCNCPHYLKGEFCKHLWATLQIFEDGLWDYEDSDVQVILHHDMDRSDGWDEPPPPPVRPRPGETREVHRGAPKVGPAALRRARALDGSWASLVGNALPGQVHRADPESPARHLVLLVDRERSLEAGNLVVELLFRVQRRDGQLGALRREALSREDLPRYAEAEDRALLALLLGNEPGRGAESEGRWPREPANRRSAVRIVPEMHEILLERLCASGRLVRARAAGEDARLPSLEALCPLTWDGAAPWRLQVAVEPDPQEDGWTMTGTLVRGAERRSPGEALMALEDGLLLFETSIGRLADARDASWVEGFREGGPRRIPAAEADDFVSHWWTLPYRPHAQLPEALGLDTETVPPTGRLAMGPSHASRSGNGAERRVEVSFDYGGYRVSPDSPYGAVVDLTAARHLPRDPDAERGLLEAFHRHGVKRRSAWYGDEDSYAVSDRRAGALVDSLLDAGWAVEVEGVPVRRSTGLALEVSSGIDWFDLEAEVDYDGIRVAMPALLAAREAGASRVRLADGSEGVVPEAWLEQYDRLAALGKMEAGQLRLRNSQAGLLDALVEEVSDTQLSVDERFGRWRERLVRVEGIEPAAEPPGFSGSLRPYQRLGLGWLRFLEELEVGGCLADDMGLGKTVQVIALLQWRKSQAADKAEDAPGDDAKGHAKANGKNGAEDGGPAGRPSIVVVPRSLMWNWASELARFAPDLEVLCYGGPERARLEPRIDAVDVVLITYGTLRRDIETLRQHAFHYAILDEAQAIKNAGSQASKACRALVAAQRFAMTGTPVENHLGELWSLFEFLNPGLLGSGRGFKSLARAGGRTSLDAARLLSAGVRPFILRRTKDEVLRELPEKTEQTLYCELPAEQRELYDELRDYYRALLDERIADVGIARAKIHILEALLRLRQAACHPALVDESLQAAPSAKVDLLMERIADVVDEGHKALVFSQFTRLLALVRQRVESRGLSYEYLDGKTVDRQAAVERFQGDPGCDLFLVSLRAGGYGLNLTAADYVFILDPWWNPAVEAQAIDRSHRIGQTRSVFAYRLIARDTVEEKIVELQAHKRALADAVVAADESLIRTLSAEDLAILLG